jgi:predicted acetyltransferase
MSIQENDDTSNFYGVFDEGHLVGGMRLLDFDLNYYGEMIKAGGVGMVAVDLLQKKKGYARDMIHYFLDHYEQRGINLTLLYPFRPDFYYRMGFGYGTKMNQYDFSPASLPGGRVEGDLCYLKAEHREALQRFHTEYVMENHGFCTKSTFEWESLLKAHAENNTLVGFFRDGVLEGYLAYNFKKAHENNFVRNNMVIREWLWSSPEGLLGLCRFLATQADQIDRVIHHTQDAGFHHLLQDVRSNTYNMIPSVYHESNTAGVGLMYRITGVSHFLAQTSVRNYNGLDLELSVQIMDTFRPKNSGELHLSFRQGKATVSKERQPGPHMALDIADLSSLVLGSAGFADLYRLGRVQVESQHVKVLEELFRPERRPQCITAF